MRRFGITEVEKIGYQRMMHRKTVTSYSFLAYIFALDIISDRNRPIKRYFKLDDP